MIVIALNGAAFTSAADLLPPYQHAHPRTHLSATAEEPPRDTCRQMFEMQQQDVCSMGGAKTPCCSNPNASRQFPCHPPTPSSSPSRDLVPVCVLPSDLFSSACLSAAPCSVHPPAKVTKQIPPSGTFRIKVHV